MYKHPEIDYQPQHPILQKFEASAACKPPGKKPKKPKLIGKKKYQKDLKTYESRVRCAAIEKGAEAALKRISKEQLALAKGKTLQNKLKDAIKTAAGSGDDSKSAEDVLKAIAALKEVKMSVGKKKNAKTGKNMQQWVTFELK